jgi:hypothetical protein
MVVMEAYNEGDKTPNRMPLRSILLGVWVTKSGKGVGQLQCIHYETILSATVKNSINAAFTAMKLTAAAKTLTVRASGTAPGEQAAFKELLTMNPFGAGAQKMINEFRGMENRKIVEFYLDRTSSTRMDVLLA